MVKNTIRKPVVLLLASILSLQTLGCGDFSEWLESDYEETTAVTADVEADAGLEVDENGETTFQGQPVRQPQTAVKGDGEDTVTILVYMNGSDLETDDGQATTDLGEMVAAGSCDKVNLLVQTMGTTSWDKTYAIASDRSQRYRVDGDGLLLLEDDLGQLDCTRASTLSDFIRWGAANYPADRYILLFWNHGGGPVYGYGYDQWQDEDAALTLDEIRSALKDGGVFFDFIGMDCCIMACLEVCLTFYDFCDYAILSEDFESGLGWSYTKWLKKLYENTSITSPELGRVICDAMVDDNDRDFDGGNAILSVVDESMMKVLYTAWKAFAYENEDALLGSNYSRHVEKSSRALPRMNRGGFFSNIFTGTDLEEYYITDIMALAKAVDSKESEALQAALSKALIYVRSNEGDGLTGLSVTLPYGDPEFYSYAQEVFSNCGIDREYIDWLGKFVDAYGYNDFYDYGSWDDEWGGWEDYDSDFDWSGWLDDGYEWDDDYYDWSCSDDWCDYGYDSDWYYDDGWYDDWYTDEWYYDDWYYGDEYYDDWYYDDWYYDDGGEWYFTD